MAETLLLIYILSQKLSYDSLKDFELKRKHNEFPTLQELLDHVETRCKAYEMLSRDESLPASRQADHKTLACVSEHSNAKGTSKMYCYCCKAPHYLDKCPKFIAMTVEKRKLTVREARLCFLCFKPHSFYKCSSSFRCKICKRRHHTLIHSEPVEPINSRASTSSPTETPPSTTSLLSSLSGKVEIKASQSQHRMVLLSTALIIIRDSQGREHVARALLDNASERSFISADLFKALRLPAESTTWNISGVGCASTQLNEVTNICIHSRVKPYSVNVQCGVIKDITYELPGSSFDRSAYKLPPFVKLADPEFNIRGKVDILLGADCYYQLLLKGKVALGLGKPFLLNTQFGWVAGGTIGSTTTTSTYNCHLLTQSDYNAQLNQTLTNFWSLECVDSATISPKDKLCEKMFQESIKRDESGRYHLKLPIIPEKIKLLGDSFNLAYRCFISLERNFSKNPDFFSEYKKIINEYLQLDHAKEIDLGSTLSSGDRDSYYLPHHAVIREKSSTTRLRVVFNASAPTSTGISLNDTMLVGPVVQPDLLTVLIRFRSHEYAVISDITKMYRQVKVSRDDCKLQRILWRDSPKEKMRCLELTTVTYGTAAASFLAARTLLQLVSDEGQSLLLASDAIKSNTYMDDIMTGSDDLEVALKLKAELNELLKRGGFHLHKWFSNNDTLLSSIPEDEREKCNYILSDGTPTLKTLGIMWNPKNDSFLIKVPETDNPCSDTKREILASIAKIFDPLGLISPVTTYAKLIMQKIWTHQLKWDDKVPPEIYNIWNKFYVNLKYLQQISFQRSIFLNNAVNYELHGFADSSTIAYGACVYLRSTSQLNEHSVKLICARSRVAPIKPVTLPRLELCAALLLTKLINKVKQSLHGKHISKTSYYTDSSITLAWIKSDASRWNVFVANRVAEIQDLSCKDSWSHVKSADNPADLISRGVQPQSLGDKGMWWSGPSWLTSNKDKWPSETAPLEEVNLECKRVVCATNISSQPENSLLITFNEFSSWSKLQRIVACLLRFINNVRNHGPSKRTGFLTTVELCEARSAIIKVVQQSHFEKIISALSKCKTSEYDTEVKRNSIRFLNPFVDSQGLLRVGGRIRESSVSEGQRFPLVLPANSHVTKIIIVYEHERLLHAGAQSTLNSLRLRYWPLDGRNVVRQSIHKCIKCYRFRAQGMSQFMADLPSVRVTPARPFLNVGVDYAGPISVRQARVRKPLITKGYICIFICMSTKAIHLEPVSDMTSQEFLNALSRMWYRRGKPAKIYSDNGSTFKGAHNELNKLHLTLNSDEGVSAISNFTGNEGVQWCYIPPYSAHWGGLWEGGVKMIKHHLKRQLGNCLLSYDHMYTVLIHIEGIVNSRPLCSLSNDPNDLEMLTPAHFLIGESFTSLPEPSVIDINVNRLSLYEKIIQLKQIFWRKWSTEYLSTLQHRQKWLKVKPDLKTGDVVLIKDDHTPPLSWLLGKVHELIIGRDGHVRAAAIKCKNNSIIVKPITKICPLPIDDNHRMLVANK